MRVLPRIGILLLVFGLGSVVLRSMNMHFRLLSWADDYQPGLGIGLAVLGAGLLTADVVSRRGKAAQTPSAPVTADPQPSYNPQQPYNPQQQYNPQQPYNPQQQASPQQPYNPQQQYQPPTQ